MCIHKYKIKQKIRNRTGFLRITKQCVKCGKTKTKLKV